MGDFNADKLDERLKQLNREQRIMMETLAEELLEEMRESKSAPKRADQHQPIVSRSVTRESADG